MSESSENPTGIDDTNRMVFDKREKQLRSSVVESGSDQKAILDLTQGDDNELKRLERLYRGTVDEVARIRLAFKHHGLSKDLETVIGDKALMHLVWQALIDEELLRAQDRDLVKGMVGTKLVDSLLMAVKLPKILKATNTGVLVELGSGTGITAAAMAMCGRRVIGIEKNPLLLDRSRENQYEIESLTSAKLPLSFISGTLPEQKSDQMDPELLKVLREADVMYNYPWSHELKARVELFKRFAKKNAFLILYTAEDPVTFTVKEIQNMGVVPVKLLNGESFGNLGLRLSENSWWTVFGKQ